jgi:choline dehydrogenase-like flavoprotein
MEKIEITDILSPSKPATSTSDPSAASTTTSSSNDPSGSSSNPTDKYRVYGIEYEYNGEVITAMLGSGTKSVYTNAPSTTGESTISDPSSQTKKNKKKKRNHDKSQIIPWRRSVILTAGAIMTPKILMANGIGNSAVLDRSGIPTKVNHPHLGMDLQDHPSIYVVFKINEKISSGKLVISSPAISFYSIALTFVCLVLQRIRLPISYHSNGSNTSISKNSCVS